jgi:hypothetical protein
MHRAIIFNGAWVLVITMSVLFVRGRQARRELDEQMNKEQNTLGVGMSVMVKLPSREATSAK